MNTKLGRVILKLKETSSNAGEQGRFFTEVSALCLAHLRWFKTLSDGASGIRWCMLLEEPLPFVAYMMLRKKTFSNNFFVFFLTLLFGHIMYLTAVLVFVSLHVVAVKDMASNLEIRWRSFIPSTDAKTSAESGSKKSEGKSAEGGSCHFFVPSYIAYIIVCGWFVRTKAEKAQAGRVIFKGPPPREEDCHDETYYEQAYRADKERATDEA